MSILKITGLAKNLLFPSMAKNGEVSSGKSDCKDEIIERLAFLSKKFGQSYRLSNS